MMYTKLLTLIAVAICSVNLAMNTPALSQNAADQEADTSSAPSAEKAYLGLQLAPVPMLLSKHLPDVLESENGLVVFAVDPMSPAEKAGLEPSDILVKFDGKKVPSYAKLIEYINASKPDQDVDLTVIRYGKLLNIQVQLGKRPANVDFDAPLGMWPPMPFPGDPSRMSGFAEMKESMERMNEMMEKMNEEFSKGFGGAMPGMPKMPPMPRMPAMPKFDPDEFSSWSQSSSSSSFVSISINKIDGDRYSVRLKYKAEDGELRELNVEGTLEEIRKAADDDEKMPASVRRQLLRSLATGSLDLFQGNHAPANFSEMQEMLKKFSSPDLDVDDSDLHLPSLPLDTFHRL